MNRSEPITAGHEQGESTATSSTQNAQTSERLVMSREAVPEMPADLRRRAKRGDADIDLF